MPGMDQLTGILLSPLTTIAESSVNAILDPFQHALIREGKRWTPDELPPPGVLFRAMAQGRLTAEEAAWLAGSLGINIGQDNERHIGPGGIGAMGKAWQSAAREGYLRPSWDLLIQAYWRGLLINAPGDTDRQTLQRYAQQYGVSRPEWDAVEDMLHDYPSPGELAILVNRNIISVQRYKNMIQRSRGMTGDMLEWYDELRHQLPSMQELVHLEAKEAFTVQIAESLGLYDEFPGNVAKYAAAAGFGRGLGINVTSDGNVVDLSWLLAEWAAHWQPLAPGQIYTLLQRLRPDAIARYQARGLKVQPWGQAETDRWLRYANYPPQIRDYVKAISYVPISIRYLKPLWQASVLNDDEANGRLQDIGYSQDDAALILQTWEIEAETARRKEQEAELEAERRRQQKCLDRMARRVQSMYRTGLLDQPTAVARLVDTGWREETATVCLQESLLARMERSVSRMIETIRREYLGGALTQIEARDSLVAAGIVADAVGTYIADWSLELTLHRKTLSTQQILKYYRKHILDRETAVLRLLNLGWTDPDRMLLLAEAEMMIESDMTKEQAIMQRHANAQAKQLVQLQQHAAKQFTSAQRALRRLWPVSRVLKALKRSEVSADWAEQRLLAIGETPESVAAYMTQAGYETSEAQVKAVEAQAKLIPLADLATALKDGKITPQEYAAQLAERGLSPAQIEEELAVHASAGSAGQTPAGQSVTQPSAAVNPAANPAGSGNSPSIG